MYQINIAFKKKMFIFHKHVFVNYGHHQMRKLQKLLLLCYLVFSYFLG